MAPINPLSALRKKNRAQERELRRRLRENLERRADLETTGAESVMQRKECARRGYGVVHDFDQHLDAGRTAHKRHLTVVKGLLPKPFGRGIIEADIEADYRIAIPIAQGRAEHGRKATALQLKIARKLEGSGRPWRGEVPAWRTRLAQILKKNVGWEKSDVALLRERLTKEGAPRTTILRLTTLLSELGAINKQIAKLERNYLSSEGEKKLAQLRLNQLETKNTFAAELANYEKK